jgi:hypothetical protein
MTTRASKAAWKDQVLEVTSTISIPSEGVRRCTGW